MLHRLALAHRLTSYDAAYLEVVLRRGLPLATLDDDLIRASRAAGVSVIALALGRQELASLFLQW
jgi:predicted nucleic acid-binding protein